MAENLTLINTDNIPTRASGPWTKLAISVVEHCSKIKKDREKEILYSRFGIGKSALTLHAIGQKYGVTRERIRQIVNNSIKKIQKYGTNDEITPKVEKIEKIVLDNGGFATKETIFEKLSGDDKIEQNAIKFIVSLSVKLVLIKESNVLKQGWSVKSLKLGTIKNIERDGVTYLRSENKVKTIKEITFGIGTDNEDTVRAVLSGLKAVMRSDDGKWGLASWPHVNPKSIRDKSKYIMIRHGKPIHYVALTEKIGKMGIKNVTKQSVHNELIKNQDFVLVGRGIYALTEWGYVPGVVEEVIVAILTEVGGPLHRDVIITKVLERRLVKPSTVILNLQKPRFRRVGKATYTLN